MTQNTFNLLKRLSRCTFLPGSYDKRAVRDLSNYPIEKELSEKQLMLIGQLAYRYRKQLSELSKDDS